MQTLLLFIQHFSVIYSALCCYCHCCLPLFLHVRTSTFLTHHPHHPTPSAPAAAPTVTTALTPFPFIWHVKRAIRLISIPLSYMMDFLDDDNCVYFKLHYAEKLTFPWSHNHQWSVDIQSETLHYNNREISYGLVSYSTAFPRSIVLLYSTK